VIETFAPTGAFEPVKDRNQTSRRRRQRHGLPASPSHRAPTARRGADPAETHAAALAGPDPPAPRTTSGSRAGKCASKTSSNASESCIQTSDIEPTRRVRSGMAASPVSRHLVSAHTRAGRQRGNGARRAMKASDAAGGAATELDGDIDFAAWESLASRCNRGRIGSGGSGS
jgi:hypothetical protein